MDLGACLLGAVTLAASIHLRGNQVKVLACRCDYVRFPHGRRFFPRLLFGSTTVPDRDHSGPLRCSQVPFLVPGLKYIVVMTLLSYFDDLLLFTLRFRESELWTGSRSPGKRRQHEVCRTLWTFKIRGYWDDSRQSTARYSKTITLSNDL